MHLNIEIKARCQHQEAIRQLLLERDADFRGTDHQIDTYFEVPNGRLKLREGNIENNLIHYHRPDQAGPKASEVHLYKTPESDQLQALLQAVGQDGPALVSLTTRIPAFFSPFGFQPCGQLADGSTAMLILLPGSAVSEPSAP